jgi:GntR family transcriptional regulator
MGYAWRLRRAPIQQFFSPFPKYLQVRDILRRRLQRELIPGERFPTEQALCAEFGVSRETVREALRALEEDGLISRQAGRGSFVLRRPEQPEDRRLTGLVEDFSDFKLNTNATVLEAGPTVLPADMAEAARRRPGEPAYRITRLRHFEGMPLAVHDAYLSVPLGEQIVSRDLRNTSMIHELRDTFKVKLREEFQRVEAMVADTTLARLLEVPLGAPLLQVTRLMLGTDRAADGTGVFVLFRSQFRSDRYYYTVDLSHRRAHPAGTIRK